MGTWGSLGRGGGSLGLAGVCVQRGRLEGARGRMQHVAVNLCGLILCTEQGLAGRWQHSVLTHSLFIEAHENIKYQHLKVSTVPVPAEHSPHFPPVPPFLLSNPGLGAVAVLPGAAAALTAALASWGSASHPCPPTRPPRRTLTPPFGVL